MPAAPVIKIVLGDFAKGQAGLFYLKRRRHHLVDALSRPVPFGDAVPDLFAFGLDFVQQLIFIDAEKLAIVDQRRAVYDDGAHVAADGAKLGASHQAGGSGRAWILSDDLQRLPLKQSLAVVEV